MTVFRHPLTGQVQTAQSPAVESFLRSRGYELHATPTDAPELKGAALDEALDEADLSKAGSADDKRVRLTGHVVDHDHKTKPDNTSPDPSQGTK